MDDVIWERSTIEFTGINNTDFGLGEVQDWNPSVEAKAVTNLEFRDTIFANTKTRTLVENGTIRQYMTQAPMPYSSMFQTWTTTFQVNGAGSQALAGATVSIKDKDGTLIYTGTTDTNGRASAVLKQHKIQGTTRSVYNNYTVTVTFGESSQQQVLTADRKQTITLRLAAAQQSLNQESHASQSGIALLQPTLNTFETSPATVVYAEVNFDSVQLSDPLDSRRSQRLDHDLDDASVSFTTEEAIDEACAEFEILTPTFVGWQIL